MYAVYIGRDAWVIWMCDIVVVLIHMWNGRVAKLLRTQDALISHQNNFLFILRDTNFEMSPNVQLTQAQDLWIAV